MKKLLIVAAVVVVVLALVLWVISWFRAPEAVATSAARPWPGGLGTLESAAKRSSEVKANEASVRLTSLGNAVPRSEAVEEFVRREIVRGTLAIGTPPALPDVAAIRELLLREPVVWEHRYEIGDAEVSDSRGMQMTVARALIASALVKARAGDPSAWEDLHAVWKLARALDGNPQMMMQTAALSMVRMVNAVAWKMPLPAPAWFGELQQRDAVRPLLEAFQVQTVSYWKSDSEMFPTRMLADSVEHDRRIAELVWSTPGCEIQPEMNKLGTDLSSVWQRVLRYRAEREATANALRVREGKPIETKSVCTDGTWTFDGKTLRFGKDIKVNDPRDLAVPLTLTPSS